MLGLMPLSAQIAQARPQYQHAASYFTMSGTSQSAAVVSGVVALMIDDDPTRTPDEVKCKLMDSAQAAVDGNDLAFSPFQQGAGLIDAPGAVASTRTGCANVGLDVAKDLAGTEHYAGPVLWDATAETFYVDGVGYDWDGTKGNGLDRLESLEETTGRAVFRNYSRAEGLPDENVWGILSDAGGYLWIATNRGLSKLDPETGAVESCDASHGLQANEFNLGAHYRSPSGELFFGGVNGFNAFYPGRIEANPHVPPVVLTSFTKINQPVRFERPPFDVTEMRLSHRDYAFSLEFAALDFTAPSANRYRYRLEGFHDSWIENGTRRWVSFTNLDPGRYLLRVQGSTTTSRARW